MRPSREPVKSPPPATPPPPNQTAPADAPKNAPPVFGVTMSSVVSGESAVAVPVGNTTMARNEPHPATTAAPYAPPSGPAPYRPVPDVYIRTLPHAILEVNTADIYPPDARALGIEGTVSLSVDLDDRGNVLGARIVKRAGHGFDEAALGAMKKFKFSPALTSDGRAVPYRIASYQFRFSIGQ